ncbi:GIY-YIG nuclease family protein [Sphingomonas sanguinis]|uniref:GIY-YIG nuclease family protein n=1 Tax=Sphingomonas sanguinis TaxID=33051 RepID=UPI0007367BF0|nr:GIY-YIG nuclease family protein [Sphingomonas sanguinis]
MSTWLELLAERLEDAASARGRLSAASPHYVYVLCRADGTPFYVGKGVQHRCFHHEAEARNTDRLTHKLNLLRAMHRRGEAVRYCIESSFETEREAHARERHLIALFGRHDRRRGPLTNQTDGGEGVSNPSEESRERRRQSLWGEAEDEERRAANTWFRTICEVRSVPVKPLGGRFSPARLYANRTGFAMSPRQAAALVATAIANRILLEPRAVVPRLLTVDGVAMAVENGVGRDILSSGMATIADATVGTETLALTTAGYRYIVSELGRPMLEGTGVLFPELGASAA